MSLSAQLKGEQHTMKHDKKRPATACRPLWFNSLQVEVNAEAIDMGSQIGRVSKGICRKCNGRSEGGEIGASGGYAAKIGIEVFALHRPTVTDFDLSACAAGPRSEERRVGKECRAGLWR